MGQAFELVAAVCFFMAASAGMMIVNKLVLRGSHLPITIVIIQMLFTVATLVVVPGMRNAIHFGSTRDVWRWARAVPPLFALMLATSMLALDHATVGAFIVVRNLAPVPALLSEAMFMDRSLKLDLQTMLAMALSLAGVILYARNDLHSSPLGFLFMGINLCAAVLERLVQRTLIALDPIDVSKQGMMMINNGVGALLLVPLALSPTRFGEFGHVHEIAAFEARQWALLLLSCINGVAISYAAIHLQKFVSASTLMVLANSNKFAVVAFGIFVLGESRSWQAVLGCVVALSGSVWYARARSEVETAGREGTAPAASNGSPARLFQAAAVAALLLLSASGLGMTAGPTGASPGQVNSTRSHASQRAKPSSRSSHASEPTRRSSSARALTQGYTVQEMQVAAPRHAPDVPACHVSKHNHTIRYHKPAAHAVPKSWAESLQIPLVSSAGDCNALSDNTPRQITQGVLTASRRVHDATCCCTYWPAAVSTAMPPDPSCEVTFGAERFKPPPTSGCRTAVLLSGKLFPGWAGAFQMSLRSVVSTLLPALPAPCIFLSMEADDADVPWLTQLLHAEPAVVAHSVEPSSGGASTSRAQAIKYCTHGAFAHLMGELSRRHAPRKPPLTTADMFRHIYLAHSMIGRYEDRYAARAAPTAAAVAIEYVLRARIDHYFANDSQPPLDWRAVEAAARPTPRRPDGVILIGSMSARKVKARKEVGVTPAWRCFVQDFFAVGGRALMARYVAVYPTLRHSLHLMPIWRWDGDSHESETLLTAHLHYAHVPWDDIVVRAEMYFGPYGCPALHQPRRSNQSAPPPRCPAQPHDSIVAKSRRVLKAAATTWDQVQRQRYRD